MSIKLRELIRNVRACRTAADERAVIAKESALIRSSFKEKVDTGFRHRNVAKLLYIHMLGYPAHFGQIECLKLIASARFPEKRIGYLGLMVLFDENQEVLMLVTNSMKNDFNHPKPYVAGLALAAMANISSPDMARDLSNEVAKLFKNGNPYIKKKAALCAVRIVRKVPDLLEDFIEPVMSLLSDKNNSVILTAVTLITEMTLLNRKSVKRFRKLVPVIVRILKNLVLAGYVSEYDVCGITDPFLQCKIIRLLRILGQNNQDASEEMSDILAQVAINTEHNKNPGNAILYECVLTIISIESEDNLRVLAVNILGRFLLNRDNNIRYVALSTLSKLVLTDRNAILRHRATILENIRDPDISIQRRALDLVFSLATKSTVKNLVKELVTYLTVGSIHPEFKPDLVDKICLIVDRYAPDNKWHIDTLVQVLALAGEQISNTQYATSLIMLITRSKELHSYSAHLLFKELSEMKEIQLPLVHAAVWCIGEYGQYLIEDGGVSTANEILEKKEPFILRSESEVIDQIDRFIKDLSSTEVTKSYILNCLMKLSSKYLDSTKRLKEIISLFSGSIQMELQQRSVEYHELLNANWDSIRTKVILPMPAWEKKLPQQKDLSDESESSEEEEESEEEESEEEESEDEEEVIKDKPKSKTKTKTKPKKSTEISEKPVLSDDIFGGIDFSSNETSHVTKVVENKGNEFDILSGIFDTSSSANQNVSNPSFDNDPLSKLMNQPKKQSVPVNNSLGDMDIFASNPAPNSAPAKDEVLAFEKGQINIKFRFDEKTKERVIATALFSNSGSSNLENFDFKVAVPKHLKLRLKVASSSTIPANSQNKVSQVLELENTQPDTKKILIRCKVDYKVDGNHVSDQFQFSKFS